MSAPELPGKEPEIDLTPEMIAAGVKVLGESGRPYSDDATSVDALLVADMFRAMWRHRPDGMR